jgi:hypothetical protein
MKAFIIVIAVATLLGGFVGGELTGNTFMLTGAVIGGVGTAAVLLGLGAFFTAQEEKKKKKAGTPALTPEMRGVFDRMLARQAGQGVPRKPEPKAESKEDVFIKTVSGLLSPQLSQGRESAKKAFGAVMTDKRAGIRLRHARRHAPRPRAARQSRFGQEPYGVVLQGDIRRAGGLRPPVHVSEQPR